jgi:hypothetical protein
MIIERINAQLASAEKRARVAEARVVKLELKLQALLKACKRLIGSWSNCRANKSVNSNLRAMLDVVLPAEVGEASYALAEAEEESEGR